MKRLKKGKTAALFTAAVLLLWTVWYARPVDIYSLGMEGGAVQITAYVDLYSGGDGEYKGAEAQTRKVSLKADTPEGQTLLRYLEELHFRRDLLNPLRRVLPVHATGALMDDGEINFVLHVFSQHGYTALQFFDGGWSYTSPAQKNYFPCYAVGGAKSGAELGKILWEQGGAA